jgi:hypothetical protein
MREIKVSAGFSGFDWSVLSLFTIEQELGSSGAMDTLGYRFI